MAGPGAAQHQHRRQLLRLRFSRPGGRPAARAARGFSQSQIGLLGAAIGLPNIPLSLIAGLLIDRFGASRVSVGTAAFCCVGAVLTAIGEPYGVMVLGRFLFGIGEETLLIALLAGVAQWFEAAGAALAMSLLFSLARVGSYMADISPKWAAGLYAGGWAPPLWLAAGLSGISLVAALLYLSLDGRRAAAGAAPRHGWAGLRDIGDFDRSYWYILTLNVLFASVFFPFRSTFAIAYFQDARGLSLEAAGLVNSWVFFAAIFATPLFGLIADRFGHRAMMLALGAALMPLTFATLGATDWNLWISTAMMGLELFGGAGGDLASHRHAGQARAAWHRVWADQRAAERGHGHLQPGRRLG